MKDSVISGKNEGTVPQKEGLTQFNQKCIWMNRMSIRIIVTILFGITVKMALGYRNRQEKVNVSLLSMP